MPSQWARRWGYVAKDAPTGRCGVTIKFLHTDETGPVSDVTCWRDSWKDFDQCVWHADTDNKPRDDLAEARTEYPERLDGAIIQGNNMGSSISFANCRMNGAELTDANFSMADFSNAMLRYATLDETQFFQTNFSRANLSQATLEKVNLQNADLTHTIVAESNVSNSIAIQADFSESVMSDSLLQGTALQNCDFSNADLRRVDLTGANLKFASLKGANLNDAVLTDTTARSTQFQNAALENSILTRTDFREANLTHSDLYQAQFSNPRINSETDFGDICSYEKEKKSPVLAEETSPLMAATWVYRRLEDLHEDNALADQVRDYHISKQEAQRRLDRQNGNYGRYTVATLNRLLTNHGESLRHLLYAWTVTIIGAGILYPFVGGISDNGTIYRFHINFEWPVVTDLAEGVEVLLRNLYFSVITFTTIGYANVAPNGFGSRVLVGAESLVGAILVALFVYVLGRRVAR